MENDYSIIGFYVFFIILVNFFIIGFSSSIVNATDYLNSQQKAEYTTDALTALSWIIGADVPITSNIFWATSVVKVVYIVIFVYTIYIFWIVAKFIRGIST